MPKHKIEDINTTIARELTQLRVEAGFSSYEKFAIEFGFARKHYWMVEKGKVRITVEYLERVLQCYNLNLFNFFEQLRR